ncbi:MAG TPA: hypothetical protein EYP98_06015, partial [Planctomycetes bacterium]|nr:hypothetical protein [Planctomycetota bacterium]
MGSVGRYRRVPCAHAARYGSHGRRRRAPDSAQPDVGVLRAARPAACHRSICFIRDPLCRRRPAGGILLPRRRPSRRTARGGNQWCGCSGSSGSVSTLGGSFKVPVVSGAATSASLSDKDRYKYFSRVIPTDDMQSLAIAKIVETYGWQKVYGIVAREGYGEGLSIALSKALLDAGVEYVAKAVPSP